jgi:hypothetical protein
VVEEVEEKHCQDDADGAEPELVNDDAEVYGSGAGDAGCCGQLCHHHCCSSQLKVEREELKHSIKVIISF